MAREPEEEETVRPAAVVRRCPRCPGWPGAPRPPLWLLCLVACWILGAVADADFSILDEAQVLASQMRRLAAEELGVVTMQRIFNSLVYTEKISNGESEVQQGTAP